MVDRYTTSVLAIIAAALVAITAQDGAGFAFADVDYNQCVRDAATSYLRGDLDQTAAGGDCPRR